VAETGRLIRVSEINFVHSVLKTSYIKEEAAQRNA